MQFASAIRDALRRLEESATMFRYKSQNASNEYDELGGQWTDSRAQKFRFQQMEPQREWMETGTRLCMLHTELAGSARSSAQEGEREILGFHAAESDFEAAAQSERAAAQMARDLASRSTADSSRVRQELESLNAAIHAASADPGW